MNRRSGLYVHGSGLVPAPVDRLNELPKVIREYHEWELRKAKAMTVFGSISRQ